MVKARMVFFDYYSSWITFLIFCKVSRGSLMFATMAISSIPTDGSGRILVTDIGTNNFNALTCKSNESTTTFTSDWYYNPTSASLDPNHRIIVDVIQYGWIRNRDVKNGIVRLLQDSRVSNPTEGVFTCEVAEDLDSPITLGIYYPIIVDVTVDILSAREGIFTVTCTARGGTVLNSSLSGPGGINYELQLVGIQQMRGNDTYSVTTHAISDAINGDTYQCFAGNGAALNQDNIMKDEPNDFEIIKVASPPVIQVAEQTSLVTVWLEWRQPSVGATVTGYVVHYSDGITDRIMRLSPSVFSVNITQLSTNRAYRIFLEATSVQLSGVSYSVDVFLNNATQVDNATNEASLLDDTMIVIIMVIAIFVVFVIIFTIGTVFGIAVCKRRNGRDASKESKPENREIPAGERMEEEMCVNSAYGCSLHNTYNTSIEGADKSTKLQQEPVCL